MARVACTGAEIGSKELDAITLDGSNNSLVSSTAEVRGGLRSWRVEQLIGGTGVLRAYGTINIAASGTGTVRLSIFPVSWSGSQGILTVVNSTTGEAVVIDMDINTGQWSCYFATSAGTTVDTATFLVAPIGLNRWHNLYMRWDVGGANKGLALSVNESQEVSTVVTSGWTPTVLDSVRFGFCPLPDFVTGGGNEGLAYFDDIIIDNGSNVKIDHGRFLIGLKPSSDVQKQLLLPVTGTHFDDVNDNSDATAVVTSVAGSEFDIYGLTDSGVSGSIPSASITIPTVYGSVRAGGLTDTLINSDQRFFLRLAGTDGTAATPTVSITPTTKANLIVATTKPGGGAWTAADLDALQLKLGKQTSTLASTYTYQEAWAYAEVAIQVNASEAASMTESHDVKNSLALTDAMSLSDVITSITNRFEQTDVPELVDIISSLKVSKDFYDTVALSDSITSIKNWIASSDSVTLSEANAIFVRAFLGLDDTATLSDVVSSVKASLALTDTVSEAAIGDLMIFISYLLGGGGTIIKKFFPIFDD